MELAARPRAPPLQVGEKARAEGLARLLRDRRIEGSALEPIAALFWSPL